MNIRSEGIKKLVEEQFGGSCNKCARSLGVSPATICRIVNGSNNAGIKVLACAVKYCEDKNIKHDKYIFF
ncbi:XRE family transcriptional regulator [Clostridium botulinum]|nr:XRE family transcriptional regulator [Clostridium botulinum]